MAEKKGRATQLSIADCGIKTLGAEKEAGLRGRPAFAPSFAMAFRRGGPNVRKSS